MGRHSKKTNTRARMSVLVAIPIGLSTIGFPALAGQKTPIPLPSKDRDLNCSDFSTATEADRVLAANRSDPHRIDTDRDGIPCENRFGSRRARTSTAVVGSNDVTRTALALSTQGIQYVWGGKSPRTGFDCSGFVSYVLNQTGKMKGYKNSAALKAWTIPVSKANLRPGDLVHYPGHVAIYLGNNMMVQAGTPKTDISVRTVYGSPTYGRIPTA